ncbi:MAG: DUF4373 domain-containing protein [Dysgonamonadaceae bacterium]|nr:DUF4373 domain-containing protein [Dysgonamonadaceae bacterium]MDD4727716.1 DUF4373 domain-containing protein [Dysgonamonadaceae bacterium]
MSKETFYFSHDYNARNDIKIKKLIVKHGYEGYGLYWAMIEDLYQNANAMPLDYDCIAYDLRASSDVIESIINDFDLFEVDGDTFGSLSVQRRMDMRNKKSRKARRSAMKRWGDDDANALQNDANALRTHCDGDANAMRLAYERNAIKERKEKERKEKDNKEKNNTNTIAKREFNFKKSLLEYGFDALLVDEWMAIRRKKKAVNSEFSFNSFISQIEKTGAEKNEVMRVIAEKQWAGFNHAWMKNTNNNLNNIENETDRRANESAKRKQEIYEFARSVGMVGE